LSDNRRAIIENLVTTLTAINGVAPYETEVARVDRFTSTWGQAKNFIGRPIIGIAAGPTTTAYQKTFSIRCTSRFYLWCHISGLDETERLETIDKLIDDVIYALSLSQSRGGYASSTTIVGWETDEQDDTRGNSLSARVDVDIVYFRTTGKS
jgi:hypothetical protein